MWLEDLLGSCVLTEDVEGYALGRGAKESTIRAEKIVTWIHAKDPIPDGEFRKRYGDRGEKLDGYLVCPVRSPRGSLIGFEARSIHAKQIADYRLPTAAWNPFFIGTRTAMPAVWAGGDIWIVEGQFDKYPLEWAVPATDAVLATVRAHLSKWHVEFLHRFAKGWVHMAYDNDETGRKATNGYTDKVTGKHRSGALDLLHRAGIRCRDVPYRAKDPGEVWTQGGAAAMHRAFPT